MFIKSSALLPSCARVTGNPESEARGFSLWEVVDSRGRKVGVPLLWAAVSLHHATICAFFVQVHVRMLAADCESGAPSRVDLIAVRGDWVIGKDPMHSNLNP